MFFPKMIFHLVSSSIVKGIRKGIKIFLHDYTHSRRLKFSLYNEFLKFKILYDFLSTILLNFVH